MKLSGQFQLFGLSFLIQRSLDVLTPGGSHQGFLPCLLGLAWVLLMGCTAKHRDVLEQSVICIFKSRLDRHQFASLGIHFNENDVCFIVSSGDTWLFLLDSQAWYFTFSSSFVENRESFTLPRLSLRLDDRSSSVGANVVTGAFQCVCTAVGNLSWT